MNIKNPTQIELQQLNTYKNFLENNRGKRPEGENNANQELYKFLTEKESWEDNKTNEYVMIEVDNNYETIDKSLFAQKLSTATEEELTKILAFPYKIMSWTGGTHWWAWGEVTIPRLIQCGKWFDTKDGVYEALYRRLTDIIFSEKDIEKIKAALWRDLDELKQEYFSHQ
jgi:hypothetical protein